MTVVSTAEIKYLLSNSLKSAFELDLNKKILKILRTRIMLYRISQYLFKGIYRIVLHLYKKTFNP